MNRRKTERGQSLVELSVSLLVLLYLLSGAVEFGLAFFQFVQLRDAAQEGALFGSMGPTTPIETRVRGASSSPIDLADTSKVQVLITAKDKDSGNSKPVSAACEGDGLEVQVSYNHVIFMPFIPKLIGKNTIPLNAVVTDTILSPPQTAPNCLAY
jgi:Flp pilus assembly protein TadG